MFEENVHVMKRKVKSPQAWQYVNACFYHNTYSFHFLFYPAFFTLAEPLFH